MTKIVNKNLNQTEKHVSHKVSKKNNEKKTMTVGSAAALTTTLTALGSLGVYALMRGKIKSKNVNIKNINGQLDDLGRKLKFANECLDSIKIEKEQLSTSLDLANTEIRKLSKSLDLANAEKRMFSQSLADKKNETLSLLEDMKSNLSKMTENYNQEREKVSNLTMQLNKSNIRDKIYNDLLEPNSALLRELKNVINDNIETVKWINEIRSNVSLYGFKSKAFGGKKVVTLPDGIKKCTIKKGDLAYEILSDATGKSISNVDILDKKGELVGAINLNFSGDARPVFIRNDKNKISCLLDEKCNLIEYYNGNETSLLRSIKQASDYNYLLSYGQRDKGVDSVLVKIPLLNNI